MEISGGEEVTPYHVGNTAAGSAKKRARNRKYRGEIDILYTLLAIINGVGEAGIKKTRLLQLSNLNSRSFKKYLESLLDSGLVTEQYNRYRLTSRGRLALAILEVLENLLAPSPRVRNITKSLCNIAREHGYVCISNSDVLDTMVSHDEVAFGFFFVNCITNKCTRLLSTLLPSIAPEWVRVVVVNLSDKGDGTVKDEGDIIVVNSGNLSDEELAKLLIEMVDASKASM